MQHFQSVQSLTIVCKLEKHVGVILNFPKLCGIHEGRGQLKQFKMSPSDYAFVGIF